MKKVPSLLLLLCLVACDPIEPTTPIIAEEGSSDSSLRPRHYSAYSYTSYLVDSLDLDAYVHYLNVNINSPRGHVIDVEPVEHNGNIVYYIINLEHGWVLLSSDKRGPIILAEADSGSFCLEEVNSGVRTWIDGLVDDIESRWYYPEEYYKQNDEYVQEREAYCLSTWRAINADQEYIKESIVSTKVNDDPLIWLDPPGHYELTATYNINDIYESVPHLMSTSWHQGEPFNDYFPYQYGSDTFKCPAGCVMIAAAQVMYYLHNYLGVPLLSPTYGLCVGDEYNYYREFGNYADSTWVYMNNGGDPDRYAAKLIGDLSVRLDAEISADGTSADDSDLPADVFLPYGVSCNYIGSYSSDTVYQNLLNNLPVIFSGFRYDNLFHWPGHCFVIDGYETYATTTYYVYSWVYDIEPPQPGQGNGLIPLPPDNIVQTSISSPSLRYFYLNWGYADSFNNNRYETDGNWSYADRTPYQFNRSMVYGFSSL